MKNYAMKFALAGAAAFAAVAAGGVGLAPAQAAYQDCPSGWICFWDNANYTDATQLGKLSSAGRHNLTDYPHSSCPASGGERTWNDCVSSTYNRTSRCFHLFLNINEGAGGYHNLSAGDRFVLSNWAGFDNKVSDYYGMSSASC